MSPDPLEVHLLGSGDANVYAYAGGRALKATDPLGLTIELANMTAGQRQKALASLQKLTNQKLVVKETVTKSGGGCSPEKIDRKYTVEAVGSEGKGELKAGTKLLSRLMASDKTTQITHAAGKAQTEASDRVDANRDKSGKAGSGSGSIVRFDFEAKPKNKHWVGDSRTGEAKWERPEGHIVLGHELVHADRYMRGVGRWSGEMRKNPNHPEPSGPEWIRGKEDLDELETIGAPGFAEGGDNITENDLRVEQGKSERLSHQAKKD